MIMIPFPVHPSRGLLLLVAGIGLLAAAPARAQLVDASPFLAPGAAGGANGGADSGALELRGIMSTPAGTRYCIFDPVKKTATWAGVDERGNPFLIKSADLAHQAVTVQSEGRITRLSLHVAKVAALGGLGGPGAPGGQGAAQPPAGTPNAAAAPKPTPADEAARLAAVAEAVRARRQMREQAAQGGAQAAPAAGTARSPAP